jgi:hypothetical protein
MMKACPALLLLLAACGAAHAERADSFQATTVLYQPSRQDPLSTRVPASAAVTPP